MVDNLLKNIDLKKVLNQHILWQKELGIDSLYWPDFKNFAKHSTAAPVATAQDEVVHPQMVVPEAKKSAPMKEPGVLPPTLAEYSALISPCTKCSLGKTRTHFVFGEGNPQADILFIGEAPGAEEDRLGRPFVGAAGQLLDKIMAAIQLTREEVYICNILKCRPPDNRDPLPVEIELCEPYLLNQLSYIKPKIICALGRISIQTLLKTRQSLSILRNKVHDYHGIKLIATYHPAALLRYPKYKRDTWEDMKLLRRIYDEDLANNA